MPRTLPWLKHANKTSDRSSTHAPEVTKRRRFLDPDTDDDVLSTTGVSPRRQALSRVVRTPSTSPPPAPPSQEFMHPGLAADDIYIMVEDEFLAIAHTYTQHLHHAEYQRLKSLARTRNTTTVGPIARPTDSITAMRDETKRKKEADARHLKQTSALKFLHGKAAEARKRGSGSESEIEEGDDGVGVGTALHGLLTSPGKQRTSLGGLQGVKSSTRAAAGFKQSGRSSPPGRKKPPASTTKNASLKQSIPEESDNSTTSGTDDDLDLPLPKPKLRPSAAKKHVAPPTVQKLSIPSEPPPTSRNAPGAPYLPLPPPKPPSHTSSRPIRPPSSSSPLPTLPFDDLPRPSPSKADLSRRAWKARMAREELEKKKGGGGGISEIPMFLV